jgi:glycosyltransferase involved in cell wall biosynthesis/LmbE family N-acetylglucosaminyl deacetylase
MELMQKQPIHHEATIKIEGAKVLVLAPYPESAVFGCGGAIMRHVMAGDALHVIVVSDGDERAAGNQEQVRGEACEAGLLLGHEPPQFWGFSNAQMGYGEFLVQRIQAAIDTLGCDLVYAPSVFEPVGESRFVGMAALEAVRRQADSTRLAMYEIEAPAMQPNVLLDISDLQERKHQAIACFSSQLAQRPHDRLIAAINCVRTSSLGASVTSAEAYLLVRSDEARADFLSVFESAHPRGANHAVGPDKLPLVSVLIRSMNRAQLDDALDSLALQTYSNIEVVVINARGAEHRPLGDWCGRLPIRIVGAGRPLMRSDAANAGLDNAAGDYLMFLDDDDWLAPDHIANLVDAITRKADSKVAYSGVEFRGENRQRMDLAPFNEPFSKGRLRGGNFIPIHAVLFARTLLAQGLRFDESFDVYEDWDFLLQLSQFTNFIHVDKVSAYYRASGTSGVGVVSDEAMKRQARERVFEKWKVIWSGAQMDELVGETARTAREQIAAQITGQLTELHNQSIGNLQSEIRQVHGLLQQRDQMLSARDTELSGMAERIKDLETTVFEFKATVSELHAQSREKDHAIRTGEERIREILDSTSWKFSAPIRFAGRIARNAKRNWLGPIYRFVRRSPAIARALKPTPGHNGCSLGPAFIVRDRAGHYSLSKDAGEYTYIEPQRPADIEARLAALGSAVSFSIVVPVYNTSTELLDALIASVEAQWYPHWSLILADDASPSIATRNALARIDHPQIKLVRLESNQGIAGATNAAIAAADGDFVVFVDHDDELTVDCLYELALCVDRDQPDFVYSDEDKLDEEGRYVQPHFKPDWSPDTMMSTMFTGHVSCVRRSLLERVGPLRAEVNGCQDWDFVLRVSEQTSRISHVPKVLYHWRIIPASVASDIAAKPYVLDASKRVRADALARRNLKGSVEPVVQVPGYFRVNYHLQGSPRISIIIPTRDGGDILRRCVESIQAKSSYRNFEIIILDNGSVAPATVAYLRELNDLQNARVIRHDKPFNFSELNNIGAQNATGELLLFLNDDTEVIAGDWLERMGGYAQLAHVGAVGAKLVYPKGSGIQHAGVVNLASGPTHAFLNGDAQMPGYFMRNLLEYNWLAVTGACLMIEAGKFRAIGGFDVSFPVGYNDIELCIRAFKKGLFNVVCQAVTLVHHESVSRGLDAVDPAKANRLRGELRRLYETHPEYYQFDPFHNPNLDPLAPDFEVAL